MKNVYYVSIWLLTVAQAVLKPMFVFFLRVGIPDRPNLPSSWFDRSLPLPLPLPPYSLPAPIAFFVNQSRDREYMMTSLPPLGPLPNNMADTQTLSPVSLALSPESRSTQFSKQPSAVIWSWGPESWIWGFSLTFSFVVSSGPMTARKRHPKKKRIYPDAKSGETAEPRRWHSSRVLVLQKHRK